jgi:hypothetical protein
MSIALENTEEKAIKIEEYPIIKKPILNDIIYLLCNLKKP